MPSIRRGSFHAEITLRPTHVVVTEGHDAMSLEDMRSYLDEVDRIASTARLTRAVFDARRNDGPFDAALRDERWAFFEGRTRLERVAVVLPDDLVASRVTMTAIAKRIGSRVRGFSTLDAAEQWLGR